jgi:phenylalanyl-tRNA synthetase alpha subunit
MNLLQNSNIWIEIDPESQIQKKLQHPLRSVTSQAETFFTKGYFSLVDKQRKAPIVSGLWFFYKVKID